jgi:Spy/CpxP family protein refolding chaperone
MKPLGITAAVAAVGLTAGAAGLGAANLRDAPGVETAASGKALVFRLREVVRGLGITAAQRAALRDLAVHAAVERVALAREPLAGPEKATRLFSLRREFGEGVDRVLTPEQKLQAKAKWDSGQAERAAAFRQVAAHVGQALGATPAQQQQLAAVMDQAQRDAAAVRADASSDDPTRIARLLGIADEAREKAAALLTPEQRAQARQLIQARLKAALSRVPAP